MRQCLGVKHFTCRFPPTLVPFCLGWEGMVYQKDIFPNCEDHEESHDEEKDNFQAHLGLSGWRTDHLDHLGHNSNLDACRPRNAQVGLDCRSCG